MTRNSVKMSSFFLETSCGSKNTTRKFPNFGSQRTISAYALVRQWNGIWVGCLCERSRVFSVCFLLVPLPVLVTGSDSTDAPEEKNSVCVCGCGVKSPRETRLAL